MEIEPQARPSVVMKLLAITSLACSGSPAPAEHSFPSEPLAVAHSTSGAIDLEVRTAPEQPPLRGESRVELTLLDRTRTPLSGVWIDAVPWMPSMGHGSPVEPSFAPLEDGKYVLSDVELYMPGRWELRLDLSGAVSDSAVVMLDVR